MTSVRRHRWTLEQLLPRVTQECKSKEIYEGWRVIFILLYEQRLVLPRGMNSELDLKRAEGRSWN